MHGTLPLSFQYFWPPSYLRRNEADGGLRIAVISTRSCSSECSRPVLVYRINAGFQTSFRPIIHVNIRQAAPLYNKQQKSVIKTPTFQISTFDVHFPPKMTSGARYRSGWINSSCYSPIRASPKSESIGIP